MVTMVTTADQLIECWTPIAAELTIKQSLFDLSVYKSSQSVDQNTSIELVKNILTVF